MIFQPWKQAFHFLVVLNFFVCSSNSLIFNAQDCLGKHKTSIFSQLGDSAHNTCSNSALKQHFTSIQGKKLHKNNIFQLEIRFSVIAHITLVRKVVFNTTGVNSPAKVLINFRKCFFHYEKKEKIFIRPNNNDKIAIL